ncbi:MAG: hypothetical protein ABJA76_10300, partial [Mucilaginibacter sp.]
MYKKALITIPLLGICLITFAQDTLKKDTSIKKLVTADTSTLKKKELSEVVISASRISESLLRSPVSLEKIGRPAF